MSLVHVPSGVSASAHSQVPPAPNPRRRHPASNPEETYSKSACRTCHHCKKYEEEGKTLRRCGGCKVDLYCDKACQKAAWPEHKKFCMMNQNTLAMYSSVPGSIEMTKLINAFIDKHRPTLAAAVFQAIYHFYIPSSTADPAATAQEREDVLILDLRSRPNARSARPEKRFCVVDARMETVSSFFSGAQAYAMSRRILQDTESEVMERMPICTVLVTPVLLDAGVEAMPPVVFPFSFPVDALAKNVDPMPWKPMLLHTLNEGIVF